MHRVQALFLLALFAFPVWGEQPVNPVPCEEWNCTEDASIISVKVMGPAKRKVNESGTWVAVATTKSGKRICITSGAEQECPVVDVKWTISAASGTPGSSATESITTSWSKAGKYTISATADPIADCCPGSGTSGSFEVTVECDYSKETTKDQWESPPFAEPIKKKLEEVKDNCPYIKSLSIKTVANVLRTVGEECCPSASFPSPYTSVSIDLKVKGTFEAYIPGLSAVGLVWINVRSPGWIGKPWQLFAGRVRWGLGVFGSIGLEVKALSDEFRYKSECGPCLKVTASGKAKGEVGFGGDLECKLWFGPAIEGKEDGKVTVDVNASVVTSFSAEGLLEVGSNCDKFTGKVCWDGLYIETEAKLEIKGFGTYTHVWASDRVLGGCI